LASLTTTGAIVFTEVVVLHHLASLSRLRWLSEGERRFRGAPQKSSPLETTGAQRCDIE